MPNKKNQKKQKAAYDKAAGELLDVIERMSLDENLSDKLAAYLFLSTALDVAWFTYGPDKAMEAVDKLVRYQISKDRKCLN